MISFTQNHPGDVRHGRFSEPQNSFLQQPGNPHRKSSYSTRTLAQENRQYRNTGGVSAVNRSQHFVPAFFDLASGQAFRSKFADGCPAPIHMLDGLPDALILKRSPTGTVTAARESVIAGFLRNGRFYTREQAAAAVA